MLELICRILFGLMLILLLPGMVSAAPKEGSDRAWVFLGTSTQGESKGIYRATINLETGEISEPELAVETVNPSFLAIHPNHQSLYACNEIGDYKGKKSGAVSAFSLDAKTGELKFLNQEPTDGGAPCHVVVDKRGNFLLTANYSGGSTCVHPIDKGGKLGSMSSFVQHEGSSADPNRQKGPHAHSVNLDASNRYAFVADLGLDKVLIYNFDDHSGKLTPNDPAFVKLEPKDGPRHFDLTPNEDYAYVINEMASTVTAMKYDSKTGALTKLQTLPTLPEGFEGNNSTADVQVHPSGKFVFGSNRGHNSIVSYKIDPKTGKLTYVAHQTEKISTPRNFGMDPTGKFLIVANQSGDSLTVFRIDPESGKLEPTGHQVKVPKPVCLKFLPVAK